MYGCILFFYPHCICDEAQPFLSTPNSVANLRYLCNCYHSRNDDSVVYDKDTYNTPSGMDPDGVIETNWHEIVDNFDNMNLKEELLRGVYGYGFERPSAIQQRAIIPCVRGLDVIAQAQSGTGKTATFSIAILQQIDTKILDCQALILAPTRELATQIQKVVIALGDYMNAECLACIGGTNVQEDMRKLEMGTHIVVGTPGKFRLSLSHVTDLNS